MLAVFLSAAALAVAAPTIAQCKYCAFESRSFEQLVLIPCSKSPSKYHQAYEVPDRPPYTCAFCDTQSQSFKQLVLSLCRKSSRGYHEARRGEEQSFHFVASLYSASVTGLSHISSPLKTLSIAFSFQVIKFYRELHRARILLLKISKPEVTLATTIKPGLGSTEPS